MQFFEGASISLVNEKVRRHVRAVGGEQRQQRHVRIAQQSGRAPALERRRLSAPRVRERAGALAVVGPCRRHRRGRRLGHVVEPFQQLRRHSEAARGREEGRVAAQDGGRPRVGRPDAEDGRQGAQQQAVLGVSKRGVAASQRRVGERQRWRPLRCRGSGCGDWRWNARGVLGRPGLSAIALKSVVGEVSLPPSSTRVSAAAVHRATDAGVGSSVLDARRVVSARGIDF